MRPNSFAAVEIPAAMDSLFERSIAMANASPPCSRIATASSSSFSMVRAAKITRCPAAASA